MKLNFKWTAQIEQFQRGEDLFLNKIHIGSVLWNSMMSRSDPEDFKKAHQYIGNCLLPGFTRKSTFSATPEEVKARIEKIAVDWFREALK